jgi:hypothetical protein
MLLLRGTSTPTQLLLAVVSIFIQVQLVIQKIPNCQNEGTPYTNGTSRCNYCNDGYGITSDLTQCCLLKYGYCAACDADGKCLACAGQYYLSGASCLDCPDGCTACTSGIRCTSCQNSYYMATNNTCQRCMDGCMKCSSQAQCTECSDRYYYKQGSMCMKCIDGCSLCKYGTTCQTCDYSRFKKNESFCGSCSDKCNYCTSEKVCTYCESEYSLTTKSNGLVICESTSMKGLEALILMVFVGAGSISFCIISIICIICCIKKGRCCCKSNNLNTATGTQFQSTNQYPAGTNAQNQAYYVIQQPSRPVYQGVPVNQLGGPGEVPLQTLHLQQKS